MRVPTGKIVSTVRGPRPVSDLGLTLAHEHIAIDTTPHQRPVGKSTPRMLLDYTSEAAVIEALQKFKSLGGATIIEATPDGCGRNPAKLREIAERLDLHIICATGWYREENYPDYTVALGAAGRADFMLRELAWGIGHTGVRPGFIKVGTSATMTPEEEITLRAAARVQREAQVGLAIHMTNIEWRGEGPRRMEMPAAHRALDIIEHEGADLGRVSLCHADGAYLDWRTAVPLHISLLKRGVFLSYDQFALNPIPEPGLQIRPADDAERIRSMTALLETDDSYIHQILLSHDISTHSQLAMARGNAYAHILQSVRPQLREAGFSPAQIDVLLKDNPAAFVAMSHLPVYANRDPVKEFGKSAWYWHRSVRGAADSGGLYFTPEHVLVLRDQALQNLGEDELQHVLASHLAIHLRFTAWLELNPVLQVCRNIFEGRYLRLGLAESIRHIALGIMTDEVSHTDLCFEYLSQLERTASLPTVDVEGVHQQHLQDFINETPEAWRDMAMLAYVIASETTFTAALDVAPTDQRVRRQIRELLRDHADDERRHQEYFSGILRTLWLATPPSERRDLAELLVRALNAFLTPDSRLLEATLPGMSPREASDVIQRVLGSVDMKSEQRHSAEPMLTVLHNVGAFEAPEVAEVFARSNFGIIENNIRRT
jgi:phosphotriesterase-related protein